MLTFAGGSNLGTCPKDHKPHDHSGSGNYNVLEYDHVATVSVYMDYVAVVAFTSYDDGFGSHTVLDGPPQYVLYIVRRLTNTALDAFHFDIANLRVNSYSSPPYSQGLNSLPGDTGGVLTTTFSTTIGSGTHYSNPGIRVIMRADKGKELTLSYPRACHALFCG
jgi:hypothetical protein